jgi:hypothetical protein
MTKTKTTKTLSVVGAPIPSDGWQALFFDLDEDEFVDEDTVSVVRVVCWATLGGRVVGLIPTPEGLVPADSEENFHGYVDATVKGSVTAATAAWDADNEEEETEEEDDPD